jgi:hypothetical protein
MPAKRLINQTNGFKELGVDCQDDKLVWQVLEHLYVNDKIKVNISH